MELDFEFELSKGKQNSLGETLKVVEHIQNNIKEIDKLFLCFFFYQFFSCNESYECNKKNNKR